MGRYQPFTIMRSAALAAVAVAGIAAGARSPTPTLCRFHRAVFFIDAKVPAVIIGAVRDGDVAVAGFGERAGPGGPASDGDTILRIGSITKAFTGDALAHMTAKGTVALTDPLTKWQPDLGPGVNGDIERVTLLNLATHAGGFPRKVPHEAGPDNDPFATMRRLRRLDQERAAAVRARHRCALLEFRLRPARHEPVGRGQEALSRAAQGERHWSAWHERHGLHA